MRDCPLPRGHWSANALLGLRTGEDWCFVDDEAFDIRADPTPLAHPEACLMRLCRNVSGTQLSPCRIVWQCHPGMVTGYARGTSQLLAYHIGDVMVVDDWSRHPIPNRSYFWGVLRGNVSIKTTA